jgi:transglutaminase-like putative cysteine protease
MVDLRRDLTRGVDVNLVRVTTSDPDPSYLRTTVLNTFDGNAWRPSGRDIPIKQRAKGTVAPPPGLPSTVPVKDYSSTVEVTDAFRSRWLPAPYPVTAVDAPGDWRYDRSTMDFISAADGQTTAGLSYRFRALQVGPTAAQLANAGAAPLSVSTPNTTLPKEFPAAVRRLAQSVTQDQASGFEKAVALQKWFREDGGFTYSLERSAGNGTDDLLTFLGTGRNSRVGYCEQFAAAMAVMGRALSIPSRVAVGFLRPEKVRGRTYVYSSHDLHAWPEMYFGGVGWVRFEPTPESHTGQLLPAYTTQSVPQAAPLASSSAPTSAPSADSVNRPADQQTSDTGGGTGSSGPNPVALALLVLLVVAALLLLAPRALRAVVRRRRWTVPERPEAWVEAGWREIRDTSVDLAIGWDDHVSVRRMGAVLGDCLARPGDQDDVWSGRPERGPSVNPEATEALRRLVGLLERARYARSLPAGATTREEVRADVDTCVAALRAGAGRRRLAWARWLPRSVLTSVGRHRRRPVRTTGVPVGDPGVDRAV